MKSDWSGVHKRMRFISRDRRYRFFLKLARSIPRTYSSANMPSQLTLLSELELKYISTQSTVDGEVKIGTLVFVPMNNRDGTTQDGDCGSLVVARMYTPADAYIPNTEVPVAYHYLHQSTGRLMSLPISGAIRFMREQGALSGEDDSLFCIQRPVHLFRSIEPEE